MPGVDVKKSGCGPTHFAACQCREEYFSALEAKLKIAREALEFYADHHSYSAGTWIDAPPIDNDKYGNIARAALKEIE